MEWTTVHHLDINATGRGAQSLQPHHAAFHQTQALLAVAVGQYIHEYDVLTGCKLASIDVGAPAVRMAYSPVTGHTIITVLEDWTIKSCDLDTEHTHVLHSPEKKSDRLAGVTVEVHIALTPLQPLLFFGAHRQMIVNVVGTVEGAKPVTKIRTDLKKPITDLACHPRSPLLYVAYSDGIVRAYNIQTFGVQYTLQIDSTISTIKLVGAGAIAFHSTLEWVFVGDRSGTLIAWDVSVPNRPNMIGITQVGSNPIPTVSWHPMLKLLITLTKEGNVQVWRTRVISNPNRPPMRAHFFEPAGLEPFDVARILTQQGGEAVYPLPRIKDLLVHPKLNLATLLLSSAAKVEESRSRGATLSREGRRQLFAVLQSARGSPGSVLKEKLAILGSAGILPDQQLQLQMQQARGQAGQQQLTISDLARKAFLYTSLVDGKVRTGPIFRLPLLTISGQKHLLQDIPVCQPIQQGLKFFNSEQRIFDYPVRIFFMDSCNLTAYNLASGDYNIYKKLSPTALGGNERHPKHMLYSTKQQLFLIFFECRGATSEVVLYRDQIDVHISSERVNTIAGCDGAFIGYNENKYAILDDDGSGLSLYFLEDDAKVKSASHLSPGTEDNGVLDADSSSEASSMSKSQDSLQRGSMQFIFSTPVQRIFSTPLESTLLYVSQGSHMGLARLFTDAIGLGSEAYELSTRLDAGPSLKLKTSETVLQVRWQETLSGHVAGILTTHRVIIASTNLEVLASSSVTFDKGFPPFRSIVWAGPALIFSSATAIVVLGWDGIARPIVTIGSPNAALVGFLNDRVLLACTTESSPRQKQGVEIRTRLVGLLEPLLIGWTTMQRIFEPKLELAEIMYQLTSRFDSLRVTPRLLDTLASGPAICGDLAVELAQSGPQFTQVLRCHYAIHARKFTTGISILKDEFIRSRDYPRCPPTSRLFQRFRELGRACIRYGQFDCAKETFEAVSDFESLLDLFICHLNPSALRRLSQKLEETGLNSELQRQTVRILNVRSTSWGQGTVLANFAAESMLPKGPEWGGGNWEIKTSIEVRNVPEWELSNEVTAYMKTPTGPIPTIIPDHLGVYLGTLKGRGTVVEVKANSLVKKAVPFVNKDNSVSDMIKNLAKSHLETSKDPEPGISRGVSEFGLQELRGATEVLGANDEQAKAEQEFKKYGMNDSSDEEDETTQKRKIKFVIKPASGTAVDVNKVKEATQQLRLGPVGLLPPLERARSATQDLLTLTAPPITASTMMPVPTMITPGVLQPAPPMVIGMGVTAGPIPEDFFHNTTSAIETLASFPPGAVNPPGSPYPSSQTMMPSGTPTWPPGGAIPYQPGGGVPPQAVQSTSGTVDPFAGGVPPSVGEFGLPGGGVPPQAGQSTSGGVDPFAGGVPPNVGEFVQPVANGGALPSVQNSRATMPGGLVSFPITGGAVATGTTAETSISDLAITMGNAPPRPSSPPVVMRPGQVPRGAPASRCFKAGLAHLEQNQLSDAMACLDEAFLALAKDQSLGQDIRAQARICAQYKLAIELLQEISRLQKVQGPNAVSAKDEMARLARHLSTLPLLAKHRIICIRTAIKRNMDVQNYAFAKSMLDLLLSKAPSNKQDELRSLIDVCLQRGLSDRSIDPAEDASEFCAATLGRLPTIGHDACDMCGSKFSALTSPGCIICGMGTIRRSDAESGPAASPFA